MGLMDNYQPGHFFYRKPKTEPNRNFGFFVFSVRLRFSYLRGSVFGSVVGFTQEQNRKPFKTELACDTSLDPPLDERTKPTKAQMRQGPIAAHFSE
jgi:hypothetical protein